MTQEELDALLNEDVGESEETSDFTATTDNNQASGGENIKSELKEGAADYRIDQDVSWPPPPPTTEHKVVHQLDDVARDSEINATETFDKLELINNAGADIEDSISKLEECLKKQQDLIAKLSTKFPDFQAFKDSTADIEESLNALDVIRNAAQDISNTSLEAMDLMQYQDIHRQKIERVINVMRALSRYMSSLFEGKIDDAKRVSSAVHIQGDNTENVVNEQDIEALIANFGK